MFEEVDAEVDDAGRVIVNSVPFDVFYVSKNSKTPKSLFNRPRRSGGGFANTSAQNNKINNKKDGEEMEIKSLEDLKAAYPEFAKQIAEAAAEKERQRIKDIDSVALEGFEDIAEFAKFEEPISAADVAMRIVAEQKKRGAEYLAGREADARRSGMDGVKPQGKDGTENDKEDPYMAAIDKVLPAKK